MLIDLGLSPGPADLTVLGEPDEDAVTDTGPEIPVCALPAGVIGLDADCIVVSDMGPVLDDYDKVARRQAVATGEAHTEPHRIAECRGCIWWPHCEAELLDRRDVSLVVRGAQADALLGVGIATVDQLARYTGNRRSTGRADRSTTPWSPRRRGSPTFPLIRRVRTPRIHRADIEVDVDMESFGESGAYLWGTLLTDTTDPDVPVRYRPFVTWTPLPTADEARRSPSSGHGCARSANVPHRAEDVRRLPVTHSRPRIGGCSARPTGSPGCRASHPCRRRGIHRLPNSGSTCSRPSATTSSAPEAKASNASHRSPVTLARSRSRR